MNVSSITTSIGSLGGNSGLSSSTSVFSGQAFGRTEDTVSISEQGKIQSKALTQAKEKASSSSSDDQLKAIRDRIDQLKQEIEKAEKSDMPEKEKNQKIQLLNQEMMLLQQELSKLENASGPSYKGGTVAKGFASSLT
jgi:hypothetical protein